MGTRWLAVPALLASLTMTDMADAELRGLPDGSPAFSDADRAVIARNKLLSSIVQQEPWLVRRVLDALASNGMRADPPRDTKGGLSDPDRPGPSDNPDLDRLQHASPEAINDLFQLLKQASGGKPRPAR
jgi:hypothetical protein